jgi:hypothetical protein
MRRTTLQGDAGVNYVSSARLRRKGFIFTRVIDTDLSVRWAGRPRMGRAHVVTNLNSSVAGPWNRILDPLQAIRENVTSATLSR